MSTEAQRQLRRSKESERRLGRWLLEHDGPDPQFLPGGGIVTSTGRIGHINELQVDVLSKTYAAENKQMKVPASTWRFWVKIVGRAREMGKEPLLRFEPTNEEHRNIPILHVISEERHAELLRAERGCREAAHCCGQ